MAPHSHNHGVGDESPSTTSEIIEVTDELISKLIQPPQFVLDSEQSTEAKDAGPINNLQDEETPDTGGDDDDRYFEAAEHESVVFGVKLKNIHGVELLAANHDCWKFQVPKAWDGPLGQFKPWREMTLSFGRIIALGGDFYSSHMDDNRTPICGAFFAEDPDIKTPEGFKKATERFQSAVKSLKEDNDRNLVQINDLMDSEMKGVGHAEEEAAKRDPNNPIHTIANAYHNHECGIPTNQQWWQATLGVKNPKAGLYTWLSYINADHFGDDALTAYKVGHAEAMRLAIEAGKKSSDDDRSRGLQDAYMNEAFALHYLTDMFSSGHIRTPRRQLHNDNYTQQSFAVGPMLKGKITGKDGKEVPVWDFQANYMHDNDSDTGLLVRNQLGHQWLCYGDKQFKESWDIINRARIMHCIQASVDEIYDAFASRAGKNPNDFNAVNLAPQPMLAAEKGPLTGWKSEWGGYDMHNTAPLWQVDSEADKFSWTLRASINDHSVFDRRRATPQSTTTGWTPTANQDCIDVQNSSFRIQGSAPTARPIQGLTTGGFLQIQDLHLEGNNYRTCVNFWGPVAVDIYDIKGESKKHQTFTLRSRAVDFDSQDGGESILLLHSAKLYGKDGISLYRLNLHQTGGKNELTLSGWTIKENSPTPSQPVKFDANKSWAFETQNLFKNTHVANVSSTISDANLVRVVVGNFTDSGSPDIATFKFDESGPLEAALVTADGKLKFSSIIPGVQGVYNFVKKTKLDNLDRILLTSFEDNMDGNITVNLNTLDFSSQSPTVTTYKSTVQLVSGARVHKSILVGDLSGSGKDQAVLLFDSPAELIISVNELNSSGFQEVLQKRISQDSIYGSQLTRPFFNALVPSEDPSSDKTLSILQLSRHRINQKLHLIFRLTDTKSWQTKISKPVEDTLASDPNYFHIKWIRCSREARTQYTTSNALLEVFSFYGVIGIRLFAPINEKKLADYEEIGRLQFMAQTSVGTGLGSEGDWGNGILTWGLKEDDFSDVAFYTPSWTQNGEGNWGMAASDVQRPIIRGHEVTRRPRYGAAE